MRVDPFLKRDWLLFFRRFFFHKMIKKSRICFEETRLFLMDKNALYTSIFFFLDRTDHSLSDQFLLLGHYSTVDIIHRLIFYRRLTFNKRLNHYSRSNWCEHRRRTFRGHCALGNDEDQNRNLLLFVCSHSISYLASIYRYLCPSACRNSNNMLTVVMLHFFLLIYEWFSWP